MTMACSLTFSDGEGFVPARRRRHRSVRPFVPVIVSTGGGGGITLPLFPEKKQDHRRQTLNCCTSIVAVVDPLPRPLQSYASEGALDLNLTLGGRFQTRKKRKRTLDNVQLVEVAPPVPAPAVPCIEEFHVMLKTIDSLNGSRPEFLYAKKLEASDVRRDHNRVFLTKKLDGLIINFLDEVEKTALVEGRALKVLGVDEEGRAYNLELKRWPSLNMTVIKSDWNKMVAANNAGEGNYVQIWGFRHRDQDGKLGFAIVFRK